MGQPRSVQKIIDLKPNQENVSVKARVLEAYPSKTINTKKGVRTISNAVIGDETGRVEVTLWGSKAGSLNVGDAVEIIGAWTTVFKGKIQLNIGKSTTINKIEDNEVPPADQIPANEPKSGDTGFKKSSGRRYGKRSFERRSYE